MNTFLVYINHPSVRGRLAKHGKVGSPRSLHNVIVMKTARTREEIEAISGVVEVEVETRDTPSDITVQRDPPSWFLSSASNSSPDYRYAAAGRGVGIYVMDSGINFGHIDFDGRDVETVFSFDGLAFGGTVEGPEHGTMAASCAAGNIYGIAKEASVYNLRYNWTSTEGAKALDAMLTHYRLQNKPAILSMSYSSESNIYDRIYTALAAEGIVLVASAGNYDESQPRFPARRSDVIAVAACDEQLRPSVWGGGYATNYGEAVDIWAGGSNGTAAGIEGRTSVQYAGGTSSACPLVSGAVALLLTDKPRLMNYDEVLATKAALLANSRKGVIEYTDTKYAGTPNRYIYTLGDAAVEPPVDPPVVEPRDEEEKKGSDKKLPLLVGVAIAVVVILVLVI